jgi:tRNA nucleotidyltransferase/poly(A) polymerase
MPSVSSSVRPESVLEGQVKIYLVGGSVRDHLMGRPSKDADFCVVADSFDDMTHGLKEMGLKVWQVRPEFVAIRGQLPYAALGGRFCFTQGTETVVPGVINADFTLARAETMYSDKRHPDSVTPTTLVDDLRRRDFTIGAIAMAEDGSLIDPHKGQRDIKSHTLRCVGLPHDRFREDPLRILRALRFMVTLGFHPDTALRAALNDEDVVNGIGTLPVERVREELNRALTVSWMRTMQLLLVDHPRVGNALVRWFDTEDHGGSLWFRCTTEGK